MKESQWIQKIKAGDETAFAQWMQAHSLRMERFAFQNGWNPKQAARVAEKAFTRIWEGKEEASVDKLYQIVIDEMETLGGAQKLPEGAIRFEEDTALHLKIVQLDKISRVSFVLNQFHGMEQEEIAEILGMDISEIRTKIDRVTGLLAGSSIEKRLEFLEKSYNRMPTLFNVDNVTKTVTEVEPVHEAKAMKRKTGQNTWLVAILGVLFVGFILTTYFTGGEWRLQSDEKFIEKLQVDFAKEMEKKQEILGANEGIMGLLYFIQEANDQFKSLTRDLEQAQSKDEKLDRKNINEQYAMIIEQMKLPSELATELFKKPLLKDMEKSLAFSKQYFEKTFQIRNVMYEHFYHELHEFFRENPSGKDDFDWSLENQEEYSEKTRMAIGVLRSQHIPLNSHSFIGEGAIDTSTMEFGERLQAALHESTAGYLTLLFKLEYLVWPGSETVSLNARVEFVEQLEKTVQLDDQTESEWGFDLESAMLWVFQLLLFADENESPVNEDGIIRQEYQEAWKKLANFGDESIIRVIMTRIIDEMEQSDWTHSLFYMNLQHMQGQSIFQAYSLAKESRLSEFILIDEEFYTLYEELEIAIPDLQRDVQSLYEEFLVSYDRQLLKFVHPLFIVGLYEYANAMENPEMMWHLMDPNIRTEHMGEYVIGWEQGESILEQFDFIRFNQSYVAVDEDEITSTIELKSASNMYQDLWMTYSDEVWKINSPFVSRSYFP